MSPFVTEILAFPTVIFTILLSLSLLYWLVSLLGLAGADGLEAADGAIEGALDGAFDGPADVGDLGDSMDLRGGGLDAATLAADAADEPKKRAQRTFSTPSKPKLPAPLRLSLFSMFAWVTSFLLMHNISGASSNVAWIALIGVGSASVGLLLSRVLARPLAPLFAEAPSVRSYDMVGKECEITTGNVNEQFGQARIDDGEAGMVINVQCEPGRLSRGDMALIVDYDDLKSVYRVEPLTPADSMP